MSPKTITLFEHQALTYRSVEALPKDPARLNSFLDEIERLNRACGQEILHLGRKELRSGSLVGVLRIGDVTFELLPKIEAQPSRRRLEKYDSNSRQSAVRNLLAMLNTAFELPVYATPAAELDETSSTWFELLTRMFANELVRQAQGGLSQDYTTREEALPVMRGRWDIQRQIRQHSAAQHQFDSIYDELTADIPLNQVFRYVVDSLLPITQDSQNRVLLGSLRDAFQPVTRLPEVQPALLEQIQFSRLNERFRSAFALVRLFLSGRILQLTAGKIPAAAFVLDMNILFERFLAAFIEQHRQAIFPSEWVETRLQAQSAGMRLYLARSEGRPLIQLRPDLIVWQKGSSIPLLVADTKYKVLETTTARAGLDPADIYQMLAYTLRLNCSRALLLYPQAASSKPIRKILEVEASQMTLFAATINLHAPLDPPDALVAEIREILAQLSDKI